MKRRYYLMLIMGGLALFIGVRLLLSPDNKPEKKTSSRPNTPEVRKNFQTPKRRIVLSRHQKEEVSPPCLKYWDGLQAIELADLNHYPPRVKHFPESCPLEGIPKDLKHHHEAFKKACKEYDISKADELSSNDWSQLNHQCFFRFLVYTAAITDWKTKDLSLDAIKDYKILTHKLMIALQRAEPQSIVDLSERVLELTPEDTHALEANVIGYYRLAISKAADTPNHPLWQKLNDSIENLKDILPGSDNHLRASLLAEYKRHKNAKQLIQKIELLRDQYPRSAVPYQFLSFAAFAEGNKKKALDYAKQYARLSNDYQAQVTIRKIEEGHPRPFQISLSSSVVLSNEAE